MCHIFSIWLGFSGHSLLTYMNINANLSSVGYLCFQYFKELLFALSVFKVIIHAKEYLNIINFLPMASQSLY